jgi:hypothetical protein
MEGVAEEASAQLANVASSVEGIEAGVEDARAELEDALTARLGDSEASLDATVGRLYQELHDRENAAIDSVDADRQAAE